MGSEMCIRDSYWGADADSILLTLSTIDDRLVILDSIVQFVQPLSPGETSDGPDTDRFQIQAQDGIMMGTVDCNLNISTDNEDYPYEIDVPIEISINLNQRGFPIEGMAIKSSPNIVALAGNFTNDIFYGSENSKVF